MVGLEACGSADPDARRAASVLSAYFEAEQSRAFRRWVWRIAGVAVVWLAMTAIASSLSTRAALEALALTVAVVIGSAVAEWRTEIRLTTLIHHDN